MRQFLQDLGDLPLTRFLPPALLRLLALACALFLGLASIRPARAQDRAERTARSYFKQAERAFNLGKFKEAQRGYEAAFGAQPLPAFLFNIAQCHRNLGNPERALFFYRRYLSLDPNSPNRVLVLDLIAEQERRLAERTSPAAAGPEPRGEGSAAGKPDPRSEARPAVEPPPPELAAAEGAAGSAPRTAMPDLRPRMPEGEPARSLVVATPSAPAPPLYRRWWVWVAGGVIVTGLAAALLIEREGPRPTGQLGGADLR